MKIKDLKEEHPAIYARALECQKEQENEPNDKLDLNISKWRGNFDWDKTKEGWSFWDEINEGNFDVFYTAYPEHKPLKVKIKKLHPDAVIPKYAKPGDAGMDLTAVSKSTDEKGNLVYGTGLAFEIPRGYVGLIFPRSSNANTSLYLTNSVGVIDSQFRGEVKVKYKSIVNEVVTEDGEPSLHYINVNDYEIGNRVGQIIIMPYPQVQFQVVDELSETERGDGGYGSTGK